MAGDRKAVAERICLVYVIIRAGDRSLGVWQNTIVFKDKVL